MLLEETWDAARSGYLLHEFLDAKVTLIQFKILRSPQIRERHRLMVSEGIYTPAFVTWLEEQPKKSAPY